MATYSAQQHDQLRLVAAILKEGADCARILSRGCRELRVDPRTPLEASVCWECSAEVSEENLMTILTHGDCRVLGKHWNVVPIDRLGLYDVAAMQGHIEALSTLAAWYDDIGSLDPMTSEPVAEQVSLDSLRSQLYDVTVKSASPSSSGTGAEEEEASGLVQTASDQLVEAHTWGDCGDSEGVGAMCTENLSSADTGKIAGDSTASVGTTHTSGDSTASVETTHTSGDSTASVETTHTSGDSTASVETTDMSGDSTASVETTHTSGDSTASVGTTDTPGDSTASVETTDTSGDSTASVETTDMSGDSTASVETTHMSGDSTASVGTTHMSGDNLITVDTTDTSGDSTASVGTTHTSGDNLITVETKQASGGNLETVDCEQTASVSGEKETDCDGKSRLMSSSRTSEESVDPSIKARYQGPESATGGRDSSLCEWSEGVSSMVFSTHSGKCRSTTTQQNTFNLNESLGVAQSRALLNTQSSVTPRRRHEENTQTVRRTADEREDELFFDAPDTVLGESSTRGEDEEDEFYDAFETLPLERETSAEWLPGQCQAGSAIAATSQCETTSGAVKHDGVLEDSQCVLFEEDGKPAMTSPKKPATEGDRDSPHPYAGGVVCATRSDSAEADTSNSAADQLPPAGEGDSAAESSDTLQRVEDDDEGSDCLGALFDLSASDLDLPDPPSHEPESDPADAGRPSLVSISRASGGHVVSASSWCRHADQRECGRRREIVRSAVIWYTRKIFSVHGLVSALLDLPCSEDVVDVFEVVSAMPLIMDGIVDLGPLATVFAQCQGHHTGITPLMCACRHGNEKLLQLLLREGGVDVNCCDKDGQTALQHLFNSSASDGERVVRRRMARSLRLHHAHDPGDLDTGPRDLEDVLKATRDRDRPGQDVTEADEEFVRTKQSALCRLAWQPLHPGQPEWEQLAPLFGLEISFKCCDYTCSSLFFPDLAVSRSHADLIVVFHRELNDNDELLRAIHRGECPCGTSVPKKIVSFLPACAAAVAGNVELFRLMLQRFAERVRRGRCQGQQRGCGGRSALKVSHGATGGSNQRKVRLDTSMTTFHSERLLAQALRHLLYAGHAREVARVLHETHVQDALSLSQESQMSLLDMTLRMGDQDTFLQLVDRFGVDVRSDSDGLTPLFLAVSWGLVGLARTLLRKGARRGGVNRYGRNTLQTAFALESSDVSDEMALMLLEEGEGRCDPDDPAIPSALESTLLHKRFVVLADLLRRGHVVVPETARHTKKSLKLGQYTLWSPAVSWCCVRHRLPSVASYLVEQGLDCLTPVPNSVSYNDNDTRTPLQAVVSASSQESLSLLDLLIEKGADVNERTPHGHSPLVLAMKSRNPRSLPALLHAGAVLDADDPDSAGERGLSQNGSFLWHALNAKCYRVAEMALAAGYRARREEWFVKGDFPMNTPRGVVAKLEESLQRPLALIVLCRRTVRGCVGSRLPVFLGQVGLPEAVADYLRMADLVEQYLPAPGSEQ